MTPERGAEAAGTAREEVLRRVRQAVGEPTLTTEVVREYRTAGTLSARSPGLIGLLVDRVEDYRATVLRCGGRDTDIADTVRSALAARAIASVVVPAGLGALGATWIEDGRSVVADDGSLRGDGLDRIDAVVTGAAVAIADTGTIVLDGTGRCGRRAITLVPDLHVCIVRVDQVVHTVPEALALLDPTRPLTFISGPSATSDIELDRVEGVHGPRTLIVVLAG